MKARSIVYPQVPYEIEVVEDKANVMLRQNVTEIEVEGEKQYEFDFYMTTVTYTPSLEADVENNYNTWLTNLQEQEQKQLQDKYVNLINLLIRGRYSIDDELAIQRQRDTKQEEFEAYNTFVEECKTQAHNEIFGE